jgi:hypothetical protein
MQRIARVPDQAVAPKGQPVLIDRLLTPGARRKPVVTADASCHGDTAPSTPSRRRAAAAQPPTTSTASANPLGWLGSGPVSGSSCTSNAVNAERTTSALRVNARSQPRTVDTGRASRVAIGRCPAPAAFIRNAAPITSTASARRSRHDTVSSTCVTKQLPQRARRGRSSPTPRTVRSRACPHGARPPPHGQASSPARNRRSTSSKSVPTMTTGASISTKERPSRPAKDWGGPLRFSNVVRMSSHTNKGPPAGSPPHRHRPQRRYTATPPSCRMPSNSASGKRPRRRVKCFATF